MFYSPGHSKLILDGLGFRWNGDRLKDRTLGFKLLGRNIAPLHFKTEKEAETALRAMWYRQTPGRFPATGGIFFSPRDSKLSRDALGFLWNWQSKKNRTLGLDFLGQNIAPANFKTQKVAQSVLSAGWYRPTLGRFPATWGIFSSPAHFKLTRDGLDFRWNEHFINCAAFFQGWSIFLSVAQFSKCGVSSQVWWILLSLADFFKVAHFLEAAHFLKAAHFINSATYF